MSKLITAECNELSGYLRYGHWELDLTDEEYEKFESMSEEDQKDWIMDGIFVLDDYSVEFRGEPENIEINDI